MYKNKWDFPHIIKIYEALWTIIDKRIELLDSDFNIFKAKVYSSSGQKYYSVIFDNNNMSIMSNDNASYYKGHLGYPSIALLLYLNILEKKDDIIEKFYNIKWKDINVANNNDFDKTVLEINNYLSWLWLDIEELNKYIFSLEKHIKNLDLSILWEKSLPPEWY